MKTIGAILKMILTILIIFSIPFVLPLMFKILVKIGAFINIDELKNIMDAFNNIYTFIYIGIGITVLFGFFHGWDNFKTTIKGLLRGLKGSFEIEGKKFSFETAKEEIEDSDAQKDFIKKLNQENKSLDSENTMEEIKEKLGIIPKQKNKECTECNKNELQEENIKLRNFAAYNMLNKEARSLLHVIYNEKYIESDTFKSRIIQGYKKRNKKNIKIAKKDINKIAQNKYDAIYEGLKFLNIIEPSEDDKTIKLTKEGKKFVEKYIEKKEVV